MKSMIKNLMPAYTPGEEEEEEEEGQIVFLFVGLWSGIHVEQTVAMHNRLSLSNQTSGKFAFASNANQSGKRCKY